MFFDAVKLLKILQQKHELLKMFNFQPKKWCRFIVLKIIYSPTDCWFMRKSLLPYRS